MTLRDTIAANLARHQRRQIPLDGRHHAAVAVVIASRGEGDADPGFYLCRRPSTMPRHPGQLALPGGRLDGGESELDAARREVHEEIGLSLDEADVLGWLDDYATHSGFVMSPVVMWAGAAQPTPDPREVAQLFVVPFTELCRDDSPRFVDVPGIENPLVQLPLGSDNAIHAPTAAVLLQFRCVGLDNHPGLRVHHLEAPDWARR